MLGLDEFQERFAAAGAWVLLLVIAIGAGAITLEISSAWQALRYQPRTLPATPPSAIDLGARLRDILDADLFGQSAPASTGLDGGRWPETHLPLVLRGVFTSADPERASAIIEASDGRARMYRVGARLDEETLLRAVHRDRVVISRAGQIEHLHFPEPGQDLLASGWSPQGAAGAGGGTGDNAGEGAAGNGTQAPAGTQGAALAEQERRDTIRRRLEELRARSRAQ